MTHNLISFSRPFKQYYRSMGDEDRNSVDRALEPLNPILRAMIKHELHFRKMAITFNITGPHGLLRVIVTDNPVRATVKTVKKTGKSGRRF